MKKKLLEEQREKAIIESFAKTFNKIKRLDEEEIDEINIAKGLASLGIAAASIAGNPNKTMAQTTDPKQVSLKHSDKDINNITTLPDDKAAELLLYSFRQNPFSADEWSKQNRNNQKLFAILKKLVDYQMNTGRLEQEDLQQIGAKYKTSPIAQAFINRDKKDKQTYTMK